MGQQQEFTSDVDTLSKHSREVVQLAVHAADLATAIEQVMNSFAVSREAARFALSQPLRMYLGCFNGCAQPWVRSEEIR